MENREATLTNSPNNTSRLCHSAIVSERHKEEGAKEATAVIGSLGVAELLGTICHDIRAALAVTAGAATELETNEKARLNELQQKLVNLIQRGNARLTQLATNLTYLSEMCDNAPAATNCTTVDIRGLVASVQNEFDNGKLHRARINWHLCDHPVMVCAEPERLLTSLKNTLNISMQLAKQTVNVSVQALAASGVAEITIEDDGPKRGSENKRDDQIMRPHPVSRVRSIDLTLALSQAIVQLYHGAFSLESPLTNETGARVRILLPLL
jgi:K+-sensing histidine kinase KdpD